MQKHSVNASDSVMCTLLLIFEQSNAFLYYSTAVELL